jgi:hypothetical protein
VCGPLPLLSDTWRVPQRVPFWLGQKDTLTVQLCPGCRVVPFTLLQILKSPVHCTLEMQIGWLPLLHTVMGTGGQVWPHCVGGAVEQLGV